MPFTQDVQLLHTHLEQSAKAAFDKLKKEASPQSYTDLAKATLVQTIVFNRRRAGEVSKMHLKNFIERDKSPLHVDVSLGLTQFEKKLCEHFTRVEIRGKRGRKVAVLQTPHMIFPQKRHHWYFSRKGRKALDIAMKKWSLACRRGSIRVSERVSCDDVPGFLTFFVFTWFTNFSMKGQISNAQLASSQAIDDHRRMAFIKEESEDVKFEETFRVKHEETEEQTDLMPLKEDSEELNEMEERDEKHDSTTGEKRFSCSQTEKYSSQKRAQQTETIRYFICTQCGKSFTKKGSFKAHMNIHTGEKPFTCQQCGKSFTTKGILKGHMMVHTKEKPFTCPQCGNSFTQKGSFNRHMRIHTGEKPYICELCDKSFTTELNLRGRYDIF
ncbi:unnamed protein product [Leuciscus chuanchicus]